MALNVETGTEISVAIQAGLARWAKTKGKEFRVDADTLVATLVSQACMVIEGSPDEAGRMAMVRGCMALLMTKTGIDPERLSKLVETDGSAS